MTLKQLEAFYWAATCRNFAVAAQRVNLSLSSLSKRIAELEASLQTAATARSRARAGLAPGEDDLQQIPGLGPVMAKALRAQGIVTFRAIAALTPDEAAALGVKMGNTFAERARRDDWFGKARALHEAQTGETL